MSGEELPVLPAHPAGDRFGRDRSALRLPEFLRRPVGRGAAVSGVRRLLRSAQVNTVCEEARCPNLGECFAEQTATFMVMGRDCTRACGFCAVGAAVPAPLDPDEPRRVAGAAAALGLAHVVLTSVNRDDLPDGGAGHLRATLEALRGALPEADLEVLAPDFCGDLRAVEWVASAPLQVFNHNVETVPRLYPRVRPRARYERSLAVLRAAARPGLILKSGLMVGLGERPEEVLAVLEDLRAAGVAMVTLGQYLRPSVRHVPVVEYLREPAYAYYREAGRRVGLAHVFAGPFVRSSYSAAEALREARSRAQ